MNNQRKMLVSLAVGMAVGGIACFACDDKAPSTGTGACAVKNTCSSNVPSGTPPSCSNEYNVVEFPSECSSGQTGKNCNQPLKDCWIACKCKPSTTTIGTCEYDSNSGTQWEQAKKPTVDTCNGG